MIRILLRLLRKLKGKLNIFKIHKLISNLKTIRIMLSLRCFRSTSNFNRNKGIKRRILSIDRYHITILNSKQSIESPLKDNLMMLFIMFTINCFQNNHLMKYHLVKYDLVKYDLIKYNH